MLGCIFDVFGFAYILFIRLPPERTGFLGMFGRRTIFPLLIKKIGCSSKIEIVKCQDKNTQSYI